jgi:hypothetical protein
MIAHAIGGRKAPRSTEAYDPFPAGTQTRSPLASPAKQKHLKAMMRMVSDVFNRDKSKKGATCQTPSVQ